MLLMLGIVVAKADTRRVLFDAGWQFTQNGKTVTVDLPHDWDIYAGPDAKSGATGTGGGWYPGGKGEYRKTFKTPDGEVVRLHFEGVYQKAEVFINGQKAGQHAYGYTPFTIDITPYLHQDKPNEVLVKVDNSEQPNCRWYSGSGIYRHVWLITSPALHIAENGVYISTPMVNDDEATVQVEVTVENASDVERSATVMVGAESMPVTVPAKGSETDTLTFNIRNPRLWSPDTPILYEVRAMLKEQGKMVDSQLTRFGVRHIYCDSRYGFQLNYMPLLINGACVHHDDGILGAMAFDAAEIRKVRLMKDAGFNLIRTSHNPPSRAFLDACDSIGMLVIDEAFDGWRQAKTPYDYSTLIDSCYREDIHAMVRRDRNHPSIICWSIGNEVMERKDIRVVTTARKMKDAIKDYCCERPVTEALCSWDSDWEIYDPHAESTPPTPRCSTSRATTICSTSTPPTMSVTPCASSCRQRASPVMPGATGRPSKIIPTLSATSCGRASTTSASPASAATTTTATPRANTMSKADSLNGTAPTAAMSISPAGANPSPTTANCSGTVTPPLPSIWP